MSSCAGGVLKGDGSGCVMCDGLLAFCVAASSSNTRGVNVLCPVLVCVPA